LLGSGPTGLALVAAEIGAPAAAGIEEHDRAARREALERVEHEDDVRDHQGHPAAPEPAIVQAAAVVLVT
jgi:hypothetical protein